MRKQKHLVVLGLGSFGAALADRAHRNGCRVTGVDSSETRVEELKHVLHEAVIADVTDRDSLAQLPLAAADSVIISLGERYEQSILCALHVKELGARRVLAKGVTPAHGRILKKLGVDQVIYPEQEAAVYWADKETWTNVVDFLPIDPEYGLVELVVPSAFNGKTLQEANLRQKFGVHVIGVKDVMLSKMTLVPPADFRMNDEQLLLVIGSKDALEKFRAVK
ncbi:MAG: TrkA family potassium uptake protein [Planctomycetaceae bacterium]|nr:TrkA family potassium uptake protein [Planctomycetaceae bacterium]